jgi:hypothetical protein
VHVDPALALLVPQVWVEEHVLALHNVPVPAQSVGALQPTQLPFPSQTWPPLSEHVVPALELLVPQVWVEEHVLLLHKVPLAAQSVGALQATQFPLPSQIWPLLSEHVVPAFALLVPHVCVEEHVLLLHNVPVLVQSVGALQATQFPLPSQRWPPLSLHAVPALALLVPHA